MLNYTSNMHTERQLAIVALEEAIGGVILPLAGGGGVALNVALGPLVNNAIVPHVGGAIPAPGPAGVYALVGALHIYTDENPCQQPGVDNGQFSCIQYYNSLAALFPTVDFHIYFRAANMRLNHWFITNNNGAKIALLNEIDNIIANGAIAPLPFRIRSVLQVQTEVLWRNISDSNNVHGVLAGAGGWTLCQNNGNATTVLNGNNILAAVPAVNSLTIPQREQLFNAIHNFGAAANIHFHPI